MRSEKDLRDYQKKVLEFLKNKKNQGLLLDMGLGKTIIMLTHINNLFEKKEINKVLICAPLRVAQSVWKQESEQWEHVKHLKFEIVTGNIKQRTDALKSDADVYVINHDNIQWLEASMKAFKALKFDCIVIDELSCYRSKKSKRFKALASISKNVEHMYGLTGTPAPKGMQDLWPQMYLIDKGEALGKSQPAFHLEYCEPNHQINGIVYSWKVRNSKEKDLLMAIEKSCISLKTKECISLPDTVFNIIPVEFNSSIQNKYNKFKKEKISEFENEKNVIAINAAVLTNKLMQFANGRIYDEEKTVCFVHNDKIEALKEIMEATDTNVLLAYNYVCDKDAIMHELAEYNPVLISEDGSIARWNNKEIKLLLAHPASAGHGLNLQFGGSTIVWFGLTHNLEHYHQFNARLSRTGQTSKVFIHHIIAKKTVEERIYDALQNKTSVQDRVIEYLKLNNII